MRVPRLNFHTGYLRRTAGSLLGDGPEGVDSTLPTVRGRTSMAAWKLTDPELAQYPASQEISLTCYGEWMPLNPGREEAQTLRASVFTLSRPLARSLFSAPLSPILCPVPRLSKPLPGAERSPVQVHSHFSCPIQLHEAESIQVKTSVHCPTLDSASRSLTATPLFWGKTPPPHPTTLLFSLTHSRERDCIFFFFPLRNFENYSFCFFFFLLPYPSHSSARGWETHHCRRPCLLWTRALNHVQLCRHIRLLPSGTVCCVKTGVYLAVFLNLLKAPDT